MKITWRPQGASDPVSYRCTCAQAGQVLLFYRYFASPPVLPISLQHLADDAANLSEFHVTLTRSIGLKGKIRVAREGFNVTVGGSLESIEKYIAECVNHWSFDGLGLRTAEQKAAFFKPSPGCACVFGPESDDVSTGDSEGASVRVCEEITPMGVASYVPKDWQVVENLSPAEFHARLCGRLETDGDVMKRENVLVDVRNHYESRIGYFIDPLTGEPALRPQVRRFGQWPQFVKAHLSPDSRQIEDINAGNEGFRTQRRAAKSVQYMTYCTGGIRCEKGSRFLAENLALEGNSVCTLSGGIQAYLMWMDEEIRAGRKTPQESLFKGKNYVFDARGATGLTASTPGAADQLEKVAECHVCAKGEDRLSKCRSRGCHLILVICEECDGSDPRCCQDCLELDNRAASLQAAEEALFGKQMPRPICKCEKDREFKLWGDKSLKSKKTQGKERKRLKGKGCPSGNADIPIADISIQITTID